MFFLFGVTLSCHNLHANAIKKLFLGAVISPGDERKSGATRVAHRHSTSSHNSGQPTNGTLQMRDNPGRAISYGVRQEVLSCIWEAGDAARSGI